MNKVINLAVLTFAFSTTASFAANRLSSDGHYLYTKNCEVLIGDLHFSSHSHSGVSAEIVRARRKVLKNILSRRGYRPKVIQRLETPVIELKEDSLVLLTRHYNYKTYADLIGSKEEIEISQDTDFSETIPFEYEEIDSADSTAVSVRYFGTRVDTTHRSSIRRTVRDLPICIQDEN